MTRALSKRRRRANSRPLQLQQLECRHLLAAAPLGAIWKDTGEYLLGTVAVTPVFFESNGAKDTQTQNWTAGEIQESIDKVVEGVSWWSDMLDTLGTVHSLDFVFDNQFAEDPFETSYEPIDRVSGDQHLYVAEFLGAQGFGNESNIENAIWRFNDAQREKYSADWAFTVFIVDASDDFDGLFPENGFRGAFALPGGLYMIVPSTRAASTIAHETGHIFWAFDEYPGGASYHAQRGYYDTQNLNAAEDNPSSQQNSIMRSGTPLFQAFTGVTSPASTLALVGWQDSDGDGVFDVLDVPLELDAVGHFDSESSQYHFTGSAAAVALLNRNSYGEDPSVTGTNSDITLNRVSEIQYQLDDQPWTVATAPNEQIVDFDITIPIGEAFTSIRWRAIDVTTGIVSATVAGTATTPAVPQSAHTGLAFIDQDGDGIRDPGEVALPQTQITIRHSDGSPLFGGVVDAADFDGPLPDLDGVSLTVQAPVSETGPMLDPQLRSLQSAAAGNRQAFHAQEFTVDNNGGVVEGAVRDRWAKRMFVAHFDQPVGEVRIDAIGLNEITYGRIEAYDAAGNLIARTTDEFAQGDLHTLVVADPAASISTVRAFGLTDSGTGIAISRLEYGIAATVITDEIGLWSIPNLADGDYIAQLTPQRLIHQFGQSVIELNVLAGASEMVMAAAQRVDSPRHNTTLPGDANQDGQVTARDALVIINDLTRFDARILSPEETTGFDIDVNNDGSATALDALLVINELNREAPAESEGVSAGQRASIAAAGASDAVDQVMAQIPSRPTAASLTIAPIDSVLSGLVNSAGRATPVESNDPLNADTPNQPSVGIKGTRQDKTFPGTTAILRPEKSENHSEIKESTEQLAPRVDPITSEMKEPLRSSMV